MLTLKQFLEKLNTYCTTWVSLELGKALTILSLFLEIPGESRENGLSAVKGVGHNLIYKNLHKYFLVTNSLQYGRISCRQSVGSFRLYRIR